ncbi:MAG: NUDIX hydrolase [Fibrobacteria bacterium]|nr:NUDIX hydrolase [Fibrobacteria bacterium]
MAKKEKQVNPNLCSGGADLLPDASNYSNKEYRKALNTVDICVCKIADGQLQVLLIKRKYNPDQGKWALPGGFVDINNEEGLLTAAKRELTEETGATRIKLRQLGTWGDNPHRDPRDRAISTVYFALLNPDNASALKIKAADDAEAFKWANIKRPGGLAFDHRSILKTLHQIIQDGVQLGSFAFELTHQYFNWCDLRNVYEIVLGQKINPAVFSSRIKQRFELRKKGQLLCLKSVRQMFE